MKNGNGTIKIVFYILVVIICIIALAMGAYVQFFYQYRDVDPFMTGDIGKQEIDDATYAQLKEGFSKLFDNILNVGQTIEQYNKIDASKKIIYAREDFG